MHEKLGFLLDEMTHTCEKWSTSDVNAVGREIPFSLDNAEQLVALSKLKQDLSTIRGTIAAVRTSFAK